MALHDHEAHLHDELSFSAGDQVFFTEKVNSEWYTGHCHGRYGMFPVSFVDIVNDMPDEAAPPLSPKRPQSLDAAALATLRERSVNEVSLKNGGSCSDHSSKVTRNAGSQFIHELRNEASSKESKPSPPKRPPSIAGATSPTISNALPEEMSSLQVPPPRSSKVLKKNNENMDTEPQNGLNSTENETPKRPPALDNDTVNELRQRTKSFGKKEDKKSSGKPIKSFEEPPKVK